MSTKIYNGYKLEGVNSINELQEFLDKFRAKCVAIVERAAREQIIREAVSLYDDVCVGAPSAKEKLGRDLENPGKAPTFKDCLVHVVIDLHRRAVEVKKTRQRDPDADWSCEVCVLRYGLALLYTENEEMTKAWESMSGVKPWPYWNNTDRPKGVTQKEWDHRGRVWDAALEGRLTPSECGLSRTLVPVGWSWLEPLTGKVKAELAVIADGISGELDVNRRARLQAFDELVSKYMKDNGAFDAEGKAVPNFMHFFFEGGDHVREHEDEWKAKAEELKPKIRPFSELFEELAKEE
jgi:hypothetical protein